MKALFWVALTLSVLFLLIFVLCIEEDERGQIAWHNYKHDLIDKGVVLDWNEYIPLPIPNDQNFFKAPKMAEWFQESTTYLGIVSNELSALSYNRENSASITNGDEAVKYLAWSDHYAPQFALIRQALQRPYACMDGRYNNPYAMPMINFVAFRSVTQVLAQRTKCYLLLGQTTNALNEISFLNQLRPVLELPPSNKPMTLVDAMINVAIGGYYAQTISKGLEAHQWQEPQLTALQTQLQNINLLPFIVDATREENAAACRLVETNLVPYLDNSRPHPTRGWLFLNLVNITKLDQFSLTAIDLTNNIIQPAVLNDFSRQADAISAHPGWPTHTLASIGVPNFTKAWQTTIHNQTLINETQIACALERYHFVHGEYPESLNALEPSFIKTFPHDIIGGQPLHYRRISSGKFLLYSVGWNETDDGGVPSPCNSSGVITNYSVGDFVWPN